MANVDHTKIRLLLAAGQVFAAKGFEAATVREICRLADVNNIAAVNYYYRDKDTLYRESVRHAYTCLAGSAPRPDWPSDMAPADKLRQFLHSFLAVLLERPDWSWQLELTMRELANPSVACVEFARYLPGQAFEVVLVKEPVCALLRCDATTAYQAAHRVKAFAIKYPGKELPGSMVPQLCAGLPIQWAIPSDQGRCKRAEKLLRLLCALGIVKLLQKKQWHGPGHPMNRAAVYGLPQDVAESEVGREWYYGSWTRHHRGPQERHPEAHKTTCVYSTDTPAFTEEDLGGLAAELERLNRAWSPRYHSSG
jgi:AcrR family transcriptional regulator